MKKITEDIAVAILEEYGYQVKVGEHSFMLFKDGKPHSYDRLYLTNLSYIINVLIAKQSYVDGFADGKKEFKKELRKLIE